MAEAAVISAGLKLLVPAATELLKKGYSLLDMDVDEKLRDLQNEIIPQMEMLIDAAEKCPHKDSLRGWLQSLQEAVDEADDVLDLHDYYLLKRKVKSSSGGITVSLPSLPPIKYLVKKFSNIEMKKSLAKLEKTAVKAREFLPFLSPGSSTATGSQTTNESGRTVTTSLLAHKVFGRERERDRIVDFLHETAGVEPESSSGKSYSVAGIVGLGGAGKTTLAQYVCDHEREAKAKHFDVIMWVHVSQKFDVAKLTREMVESASEKGCPDVTNLDTLQRNLADSIRSKKFLLVFDDAWSEKEAAEEQWEQLLAPLSAGNKGSKILITTREKGVAEALHARYISDLEELEINNFLLLFTYYAFGDAKIEDNKLYKELEEIVKENAPRLCGSPLAAKMVGGQLRKRPDVDFWKSILSGDVLRDTRKSLLWSYKNLNAPLQRCFSYCSLFPKGHKIEREELIRLWIAEGFIKTTDESKRIEDVGQEYFHDLLSSSFFQPMEKARSSFFQPTLSFYIMHDLLHDLTEMVSKDRCLRVEENLKDVVVSQGIRHLSLDINKLSDIVERIHNLKNLRTLIFLSSTFDEHISVLLPTIFVKLKKLRVVDLSEQLLEKIPESIRSLKHLRYLNVRNSLCAIFPEFISTLYHLEFLYLPTCESGAKGAETLASLIKLQNLQHLYITDMILDAAGINCLNQLGYLRKFHGDSIRINGLENVKEKVETPVEMTGAVHDLCLKWSTADNISRSSEMDAQVLEGLRPPPCLERLTIEGYQGCLLPSWMVGDRYLLPNLSSLKLHQCRRLKQLPILSPTLQKLVLDGCSLPIVAKEDVAIIRRVAQDVRISQVVTFMEGLVATHGSLIVSEIEHDLWWGYDSQKLRNRLEKAMDIVYQNPQEEEEEVQLVLPSSLKTLDIKSCTLTDSSLRQVLRGLTSVRKLNICNIVSLTSLPSADVLGCVTMLQELNIDQCWFLTSLVGVQALGSLEWLFISFCPNLSAEGGSTSILPSSLTHLEIEACHWKHLDDSQTDVASSIDSDSESSDNITSLQLGHLKSLTSLRIAHCPNVGSLLGLQELNNLEELTLMGCPKLTHAETKLLGSNINTFKTDAPPLLYMLLAEEALASLRRLEINKFKKESFRSEEEQVFQHLTSLTSLRFESCSIKSLPNNLEALSSLQDLYIADCPNIMSLPAMPRSLSRLQLYNCNPVLKKRCQKPHGEDWGKIAHIPVVNMDGQVYKNSSCGERVQGC